MKLSHAAPPRGFRDGKIKTRCLFDLLLDEMKTVLLESENLHQDQALEDSTRKTAEVFLACMRALDHPSIRRRIRQLEGQLSSLWLEPGSYVAWPPKSSEHHEGRNWRFRPGKVARLRSAKAGEPSARAGRARFAAGDIASMVPCESLHWIQQNGFLGLPVGTFVEEKQSEAELGVFGRTCLCREGS